VFQPLCPTVFIQFWILHLYCFSQSSVKKKTFTLTLKNGILAGNLRVNSSLSIKVRWVLQFKLEIWPKAAFHSKRAMMLHEESHNCMHFVIMQGWSNPAPGRSISCSLAPTSASTHICHGHFSMCCLKAILCSRTMFRCVLLNWT